MGTKFIMFNSKTSEEATTTEEHKEDEPNKDEGPSL